MMGLPLPNLDDRRFQEFVDDAKRLVQQRCPEWSDHNVSDPGVTLIEAFAYMADNLVYRLNRVPDKLYLAFLELIGVRPHGPAAAMTGLTFWLSAARPDPVTVSRGTEVASERTERNEPVVFQTVEDLVVPPRSLAGLATQGVHEREPASRALELRERTAFACFAPRPGLGDSLLFCLDDAAPRCVIVLRVDADAQGAGVNPDHPPLRWEAWDGGDWRAVEVDSDGTGGLNRPGDVVLHVPSTHTASTIGGLRGGWLRCVVVPPEEDYSAYRVSPEIRAAAAFTIGGTVDGRHADTVVDEVLGLSEGLPAQSFPLSHTPVVDDGRLLVLEVAAGPGWQTWREVESFSDCGPEDTVFRVDRVLGIVELAPAVRESDGSVRHYGVVPPKGAPVRIPEYRCGGGPAGNVAARVIDQIRTPIPFVERVVNRRPAYGGVAAETLDEVRTRGPLDLRTRDRAVTVEDHEVLALRATPTLARVRCVPELEHSARLLVVPHASRDADGRLRFEDLVPTAELLDVVGTYLDERRLLGSRILVEPPFYQGVTVVTSLVSRPRFSPEPLRMAAVAGLFGYLDPLSGGPDGIGWPFGRPVQVGEVYAVLQRLPGVEMVEEVRLFAADPITGLRGEPVERIVLERNALVFSFAHQVRVTRGS